MALNERERMNDNDKSMFNKIKPKLLKINETSYLSFKNGENYYGLGWSHNFRIEGTWSEGQGIWSEGQVSTLLFRTEKNYGNIKLEIFCRPYVTKKNSTLAFDIYVNNSFNKNIELANKNKDKKIEILIDEKDIINNEIKIDFNFKNLISPYEAFESPDSRKLGILIKNIRIIQI